MKFRDLPVSARVLLGIIGGIFFGVFLTFLAGIAHLRGPDRVAQGYAPFLALAVLYLAAGVFGGIIVGILFPRVRNEVGAMLLGATVALPVYGGAGYLLEGEITRSGLVISVILSAVVGGAAGRFVWKTEVDAPE